MSYNKPVNACAWSCSTRFTALEEWSRAVNHVLHSVHGLTITYSPIQFYILFLQVSSGACSTQRLGQLQSLPQLPPLPPDPDRPYNRTEEMSPNREVISPC